MFIALEKQFLHLSARYNLPDNYPLFFSDTQTVSSLVKTVSMKLGVLCRLRQFFFPYQLLNHYRGLIRPLMEYPSQAWGGSTHTALLNRVESKTFRLINSPPLTDGLQSLTHRLSVASLSIFYRYFHGYCSSEFANCRTPPLLRPRCTRLSSSHPYSTPLPNARVNQHLHSSIPFTGKLCDSLADSVSPPSCNLNSFKRGVSKHLHH